MRGLKMIYTNISDIRKFCLDNKIKTDILSVEECMMLGINGLYIYYKSGYIFMKINDLDHLKEALLFHI
jgi:hypothetical protein